MLLNKRPTTSRTFNNESLHYWFLLLTYPSINEGKHYYGRPNVVFVRFRSQPSDDSTSKSVIYHTAMTLMTERCSSTVGRNRRNCGSAVKDKQANSIQAPQFFYVEQNKPTPMTPLQVGIWSLPPRGRILDILLVVTIRKSFTFVLFLLSSRIVVLFSSQYWNLRVPRFNPPTPAKLVNLSHLNWLIVSTIYQLRYVFGFFP